VTSRDPGGYFATRRGITGAGCRIGPRPENRAAADRDARDANVRDPVKRQSDRSQGRDLLQRGATGQGEAADDDRYGEDQCPADGEPPAPRASRAMGAPRIKRVVWS